MSTQHPHALSKKQNTTLSEAPVCAAALHSMDSENPTSATSSSTASIEHEISETSAASTSIDDPSISEGAPYLK